MGIKHLRIPTTLGRADRLLLEDFVSTSILPVGKSTLDGSQEEIIIFLDRVKPKNAPWDAKLPGNGEQPDHCGVPSPHYCRDCRTAFYADSTCRMRTCPSCYEKWGAKEASKASRRVWAGYVKALAEGREDVRVHHCIVSVPYLGQSLDELRKMAKEIARSKGSSGEAIIPHPFRNEDDLWLMDGTVHFHIVAIFPDGRFSPAVKGEPFIWKVIPRPKTKNDYTGIHTLEECKKLIAYQLSHAGIVEGKHSLTWSGDLAYNKLRTEDLAQVPEDTETGQICPNCGSRNTEPCEQYDMVPTFSHQSFENLSEFRKIQVHPYPEGPAPKRIKLVNRWLNEDAQ